MGLSDWCVCKLSCCIKKKEDPTEPSDSLCDGSERVTALISFFVFGLINNFAYVVFLTGAEKMIPGKAAMVLLAEMLPVLFVQGVAPFFIERIPFWIRVTFITLSASGAFLLVAFFEQIEIKFLGIVIGSVSCGFGEITFMALSSGYHKNTVSMYSSGTGAAGVFGSLSYLALSTWIGLSARNTLFVCSPVPLAMGFFYFCILPERISYEAVLDSPINSTTEATQETDFMIPKSQQSMSTQNGKPTPMTFKEKLTFQGFLFRYTGPLFLVYFSEYITNQGVFPALTFPRNPHIKLTDQYTYYQFFYQVGVFISRSSVNVIQIKALWTMAIWQAVNFGLLFSIAYFNFVPTIWIIFPIIFYEGLLGGAVFVNAFYLASEEIPNDKKEYGSEEINDKKEYGMSSISVWYSIAILLAGVAAIWLAPWLVGVHSLYPLTNSTNQTPPVNWTDDLEF